MVEISEVHFQITHDRVQLLFPYFSSHTLDARHPEIERAVLAFHGGGDPIAKKYLERVQDAAAKVPDATRETLIVAPQFAKLRHLEAHYGSGNVPSDILYYSGKLFWGGHSLNTVGRVSSFAVIDAILAHICDRSYFPNLKRIVLVGHSGGGQIVNRYAASAPFQRTGIPVRFIVMNPNTYLYFNADRIVPNTRYEFELPSSRTLSSIGACSDDADFAEYNEYGHGLDELWEYHNNRGINPGVMIDRYRSRNVIYLLGFYDNDPNDHSLNKSCAAMLQGTTRLERGLLYFNYLKQLWGDEILDRHQLEVVPFAGHSGRQMITSDIGVKYIFEDFEEIKMTTLADYKVVRDTKFDLSSGRENSFELVLSRDLVRSGNSKRPMISFFSDPRSNARALRCTIQINGQRVVDYTYSGGVGRQHTEVLRHDQLNPGETNRIMFRVESGSGSVSFSDVVLWYQRGVHF